MIIRKSDLDKLASEMSFNAPFYKRVFTNSGLVLDKGGFTLIELLVVIAIIGLLASVVMVALSGARAKSRDAKRLADMNQMSKAMELYYTQYNSYPTIASAVNFSTSPTVGQPPVVPNEVGKLPIAPTPADGTCGPGTGNGVNDYYMYANVTGAQMTTSSYTLTFCLGNATGGLSGGPHTLSTNGFQ